VCYARGIGAAGRTMVTAYYTADWRVSFFDMEKY
jgi:hypothetical protein